MWKVFTKFTYIIRPPSRVAPLLRPPSRNVGPNLRFGQVGSVFVLIILMCGEPWSDTLARNLFGKKSEILIIQYLSTWGPIPSVTVRTLFFIKKKCYKYVLSTWVLVIGGLVPWLVPGRTGTVSTYYYSTAVQYCTVVTKFLVIAV